MNLAANYGRLLDEADARQLPALIAEWLTTADARHWIARALRIDLALLVEHPQLVVPCLARRFACPSLDDAAAFFRTRPVRSAALQDAHDVVEKWAQAYSLEASWLRSLRPLVQPVDSGVVEEYRTSARGRLVIDDDHVGVVPREPIANQPPDDPPIAWERVTGRRAEPREAERLRPVEPAAPTWTKEWKDSSWGKLVLTKPALDGSVQRLSYDFADSEIVRGVRPLGDSGLLLVAGDDLDMDDFYFAFDPATQREVWRYRGSSGAFVVRGDDLVIAVGDRVEIRDVMTGKQRAAWTCADNGELAISKSGTIATRSGSVIRVWDRAIASAAGDFAASADQSFVSVQWSPDGARLLTENLLCDGARGTVVARLPMNGSRGWLEGGPPRACQRLVAGYVAEVLPWHTTLWSAETGDEVVEDSTREGNASDVAAFDRTGRYQALYRDRRHLLVVWSLRDGSVVFERPRTRANREDEWSKGPPKLGFTVDGDRLLLSDPLFDEHVAIALPSGEVTEFPDEESLPWEPQPTTIAIRDGLLHYRELVAPADEASAVVSPNGTHVATVRAHYAVFGPSRLEVDQK